MRLTWIALLCLVCLAGRALAQTATETPTVTATSTATYTPTSTATLTPTITPTPTNTLPPSPVMTFQVGGLQRMQQLPMRQSVTGTPPAVTVVGAPPAGMRIYLFDVDAATTGATTGGGLQASGVTLVPMESAGAAVFPFRAWSPAYPLALPPGTALTLGQTTGAGTLRVSGHYGIAP